MIGLGLWCFQLEVGGKGQERTSKEGGSEPLILR